MKRRLIVPLLAGVLALSACGSRVTGEEVLAGAGGGTVRLDDASIAELSKAAAAGGGGTAPVTDAGSAAAPAPAAPADSGTAPDVGVQKPAPGTSADAATKPGRNRPAAAAAKPAAGTAPAAANSAASCTSPGTPLKVGQIGAFSGVSGPITANARTAMAAWVQAVNTSGGIACHPVQLYAVDDGGDPAKASALFQQLVREKGVQAIVGLFDPLGFKGIRDSAERLKVPVVGGDGLDFAWNDSPYLFPAGAGILGIVRGAVRQARDAGKTNFGLLYCVEAAVCTNVTKVVPPETESAGGKVTYSAAISLTQPDFTAQCQAAKNANVEALGLAMDGASMARVARSCATIGYHPLLVTNGLVLSASNAADPSIRKNMLSSSSPVAPWMPDTQDTPGQREYHAALKKYAPQSQPTGNSMAAWAAGKLLEAAIANLGPVAVGKAITSADVMAGLGKINKETLGGLTPPMTFKPGQKFATPMNCVYFTLLTEKGWTAPRGSKPVCT
jgi:branched-chain amino acid transport system substrate-binding protein